MKTIGELIKSARTVKKISRYNLARKTKIKKDYIEAIENEKWELLPDYPVVVGFVKSLASALKIGTIQAVALLRRDYPPKKLPVNPKPDVSQKLSWSPRITFIVGVLVVVLGISGYLLFQYFNFVKSPTVEISQPIQNQIIDSNNFLVEGKTDPDSTVIINNQPAIVDEYGKFSAEIEVFEGTKEIIILARTRAGKETRVVRNVDVQLE